MKAKLQGIKWSQTYCRKMHGAGGTRLSHPVAHTHLGTSSRSSSASSPVSSIHGNIGQPSSRFKPIAVPAAAAAIAAAAAVHWRSLPASY